MDSEAERQIHRLFGMLDTDGNGTLEAVDFAVMSKNPGTAKLWNQLKENFDANGDESVRMEWSCSSL
jgi:Ca2+-binding EF-hand superfamily protein